MNIHSEFHRFLNRQDKELLMRQRGIVVWLCGLSGSGKSTIANATERILHGEGRFTAILDGDSDRLLELIAALAPPYPAQADVLRPLAEGFRYEQMLELLKCADEAPR